MIKWYCIIFYLLCLYKWMNGMFMYQLQPSFFYTRKDMVSWLFMQTGIHQWLLNNASGCVIADVLFYSMPVLFLLFYCAKKGVAPYLAVCMLLVNWIYVQCYTLYPTNSIEGHIAWLLFPVIFIPRKENSFVLLFEGLRYFFLFFFASAAIWKFVQGGIFNVHEMSGILLLQHNQLLTSSPDFWESTFYFFLIQHNYLSYLLYFSAMLLEAFFIIGFFTKRYNRLLIGAFFVFVITDYLVMRIPYFEIMPLVLTLALKSPENKQPAVGC